MMLTMSGSLASQSQPSASTIVRVEQSQQNSRSELRMGFIPDPYVLRGSVIGQTPMPRNPRATEGATERDGSRSEPCRGQTSASARHRVRLQSRMGFLRIFATPDVSTPERDLTLAVHTSDDTWFCSDDRFGRIPSIEAAFGAGEIEIYVGQKTTELSQYEIRLTETRSVRPRQDAESDGRSMVAEVGLTVPDSGGVHGNLTLRRGFLPDPRELTGTAGGEIDLAVMGGECRGFLGARAAHRVELATDFGFLGVHVDRAGDASAEALALSNTEHEQPALPTALVILAPNGELFCRSVTEAEWTDGRRAIVARDQWPQGQYWVWVATSEPRLEVPYTLVLSEVRRAR